MEETKFTLDNLIYLFSFGAWVIMAVSGLMAIIITMKGVFMIPHLGEQSQMRRDVTVGHILTTIIAGVAMMGSNIIVVAAMITIGASETSVFDPHDILEYGAASKASTEQLKITMAMLNMSRMAGIWSLYIGFLNATKANHPEEQIREQARSRAMWGIGTSLILIFPGFWIASIAVDIPIFSTVVDLINQLG